MYALRPGLSYCVVDGIVIFLDAPGDRYFGLTLTASQHFRALIAADAPAVAADADSAGDVGDNRDTNMFVRQGILVETDPDQDQDHDTALPVITRASREWQPPIVARRKLRHQLLALVCILATLVRLKACSFASLIRPLRSGNRPALAEPPPHLIAAFLSVVRLLPWRLECLPMSLSLRTYLELFAISSELILAVTVRPFAAHCWIQVGDILIGDTLERIAPFTPIRCVR